MILLTTLSLSDIFDLSSISKYDLQVCSKFPDSGTLTVFYLSRLTNTFLLHIMYKYIGSVITDNLKSVLETKDAPKLSD